MGSLVVEMEAEVPGAGGAERLGGADREAEFEPDLAAARTHVELRLAGTKVGTPVRIRSPMFSFVRPLLTDRLQILTKFIFGASDHVLRLLSTSTLPTKRFYYQRW